MFLSSLLPRASWLVLPFTLALLASGLTSAQTDAPGKRDRDTILRELRDVSRAGMDRRLGPDYASYYPGAKEKLPAIWMAPSKQDPGGRRYQIGGPWTKEGGDFSSTQGQVLYVPDQGPGVDLVTILEWSNGCFSERPEAPWWGGFRPEPTYKKWQKAAKNGEPGQPIAMARGMASWANCGVLVFSSGLVATAGTVTGRGNDPTLQLPAEKLPTAISITNKNEFALITVCDLQTKKGQVAVVALESSGKTSKFAHEWPDAYPGLPNVAVFTGMKLLGYLDLPGIEFPTSVTAVGNRVGGRVNGPDGHAGLLRTYDLSKQAHRDIFYKGSNAQYVSTAGFAVVVGKYENKAAFIDLQALFTRVREMYFTTEENFQKTRDFTRWPYTFEADPSWMPTVVKVIDVPEPTAVLASMTGGAQARAFIASKDGTVGIYKVGGLATEAPATADGIERVAGVKVGRNPTWLTYQKYRNDTILAVARGDRQITWVQYAGKVKEPQVVRTLRDERLRDPVYVEVADTHGIETSLLTVADFQGRQIINYRYSPVVFATQGGARFGMGPDGKDAFECGGLMEFPGFPLCVCASNVN